MALARSVAKRMARIAENRAERKVVDFALLRAALPLLLLVVATVFTQREFSTSTGTLAACAASTRAEPGSATAGRPASDIKSIART